MLDAYKKANPAKKAVLILAIAFLVLAAISNFLNRDISTLLTGVDEVRYPNLLRFMDRLLNVSIVVNIIYSIYIILNRKALYEAIYIVCLIVNSFYFFISIYVLPIYNPYDHLYIKEERVVINGLLLILLLILSAVYRSIAIKGVKDEF